MEWIAGAALLPLLLCGLMCVGGVLLAAVGLRRTHAPDRSCCNHTDAEQPAGNEHGVEQSEIAV